MHTKATSLTNMATAGAGHMNRLRRLVLFCDDNCHEQAVLMNTITYSGDTFTFARCSGYTYANSYSVPLPLWQSRLDSTSIPVSLYPYLSIGFVYTFARTRHVRQLDHVTCVIITCIIIMTTWITAILILKGCAEQRDALRVRILRKPFGSPEQKYP